jgi:Zn-dependent protease
VTDRWLKRGPLLAALALAAVVYAGSRVLPITPPARTAGPAAIAGTAGLVLAAVIIAIVLHELGQAAAARLLGQRVSAICLGGPPALVTIGLGTVQLGLGFRLRGAVSHSADRLPALRRAVVDAAGPVAGLLPVPVYLLLPLPPWPAAILAVTTAAWELSGLVPARSADGRLNDGARLLRAMPRRRADAEFRWLLEQPGWTASTRAGIRQALAVARLRQGRMAEVEPLCAGAFWAGLPPDAQATLLAATALARHALGQPGRPPLDAALALGPDADLVGEAMTKLAGPSPP